VGGWREAWGGLRHSTLPALFGVREKFGVGSIIVFLSRILLLVVTALFPLLVRKSITSSPSPPAKSLNEGLTQVLNMIMTASHLDVILGVIAIFILIAPKLYDLFSKTSKVEIHSPFYDLTAALRKIPIQPTVTPEEVDDALQLALMALREEMATLIGDTTHKRVTDVSLLEFCDQSGTKMQVRARTANHVGVGRPIDSARLVAFYVAKEGRNFAEHDFKNKRNPFPPKRVSVIGFPQINYRSVLYIPIIYSEVVNSNEGGRHGAPQAIDRCGGVICVHSSKPFRFWRWGDHAKGVGGFSDVAFGRSMPYIAVVEKLLSPTAHKVKLEVE
jgi:hypothetical protein